MLFAEYALAGKRLIILKSRKSRFQLPGVEQLIPKVVMFGDDADVVHISHVGLIVAPPCRNDNVFIVR